MENGGWNSTKGRITPKLVLVAPRPLTQPRRLAMPREAQRVTRHRAPLRAVVLTEVGCLPLGHALPSPDRALGSGPLTTCWHVPAPLCPSQGSERRPIPQNTIFRNRYSHKAKLPPVAHHVQETNTKRKFAPMQRYGKGLQSKMPNCAGDEESAGGSQSGTAFSRRGEEVNAGGRDTGLTGGKRGRGRVWNIA